MTIKHPLKSAAFSLMLAPLLLAGCMETGGPVSIDKDAIRTTKFGKTSSIARTMIALVPKPGPGEIKFGTVGMDGSRVLVMSRSRGVSAAQAKERLITACLKSGRGARVGSAEMQERRGELGLFINCKK